MVFTGECYDRLWGRQRRQRSHLGIAGQLVRDLLPDDQQRVRERVAALRRVRIAGGRAATDGRKATFDATSDTAIYMYAGGEGTTVHNVNFLHGSNWSIYNATGYNVAATNDYWGHADGPAISSTPTYGEVAYDPWRTEPVDFDTIVDPEITGLPGTAAVPFNSYLYDADGRAAATGTGLTWSKILGPADFTIDPVTGQIDWVPADTGDYVVGIAVAPRAAAPIRSGRCMLIRSWTRHPRK